MCEHMEQVKNAQRTLKKEEVCIQCSSEMLQILLYFMCKKSHAVVFSFFNSCIPYECPEMQQKWKHFAQTFR